MAATLRQRCLIHSARNVLAKVPKNAQADVKVDYWAIFDLPDTIEPGLDAVTIAQHRIDAFAQRWRDAYPATVRWLLNDRDSLTVYLRFPREHWIRIRHSNFIERTFGETRRRVKVIGRPPGEHSCLSLVWAVLDRASAGWRGFAITPAGLRLLAELRHTLHDPPTLLRQSSTPPPPRNRHSTNRFRRDRITSPTTNERNPHQATFAPLLGRHLSGDSGGSRPGRRSRMGRRPGGFQRRPFPAAAKG